MALTNWWVNENCQFRAQLRPKAAAAEHLLLVQHAQAAVVGVQGRFWQTHRYVNVSYLKRQTSTFVGLFQNKYVVLSCLYFVKWIGN